MNKKLLCLSVVFFIALAILDNVSAEPRKKYIFIEDKIDAEGSANVIIRVSTQAGQKASRQAINTAQDNLKYGKELKIINAYYGELTKKGLKDLKKLQQQGYQVEIYEDIVFQLYAEKNDKYIRTTLDNSIVSIGANYSREVLNITGRNITVAVIDSGIDYNHTDLGGCFGTGCRVKDGYDFENNDSDPYDDYGHGTHVAGIIGANGTLKGVAPEVEFLAVKSCNNIGNCKLSHIIEGIEWAADNGADIISMSLGGSFSDTIYGNTGKDSTSLAAEAARNSGKIVVIAGGNHGPGISTIAVPGAAENVITVGNIDDKGTPTQADDTVADSSSRGPSAFGRLDPDVVAPGEFIYSTYPDDDYQTMSGTSMATPHVSGIAALLLEQNGSMTPTEVRRIIMNSAVNISGKVFEVGAGEVNAKNALLFNLNAIVESRNSYNASVLNDRWEFILPINGTEYANITIYNTNEYEINFSLSMTGFENMENDESIDTQQFSFPKYIIVPANDEYKIVINFTTKNFSSIYASTYGGKLMLLGNHSKNISIPIVVTVPIKNYAYITRTAQESGSAPYINPSNPGNGDEGDVLYYAYYNMKAGNENIKITWNDSSNDLDLYVYNSTADFDDNSGNAFTTSESLTTTNTDAIKWIRIHAYYFTAASLNFTINITDNGNTAPNITNVTNAEGVADFNFSLSENVTIIFYFTDIDDDLLIFTFNDTRYVQESIYSSNVTYVLTTNDGLLGEHYVRLTIQDEYGATTYRDIVVGIFDVQITSFYPTNLAPVVRKNNTINFMQTSVDPDGNPLYYFWYIDGILNSTSENLTLNTTDMSNDNYNVTFMVTNNFTNATKTWNLTIDKYGPSITIVSPNGTINDTLILIRFNISDVAGISSCWYNINNSQQNMTINGCTNTSTTLFNGDYTITLYSNDSFGFINSANKTFRVVDTTPPMIISKGPSGEIDYTDEVTLTVTLNENSTCKRSDEDESYASMNHLFTSTGITNTENYDVQGGESYLFYVRCIDIAGNENTQQTVINFSVKEYGGSSRGGGGGGRTASPAAVITPSTSSRQTIFIIEATDNISFNINSNNIALKNAFIKIRNAKRSVEMTVIQHELTTAPSTIGSFDPARQKYAFLELRHSNLDNSEIYEARLRFMVKKSWIDENYIDMSSIKLYRYTDSWSELPTTIYSQDSTSITYEAISPGLSYFVIAGKQNIEAPALIELPGDTAITGNSVLLEKDVEQEKPMNLNDAETEDDGIEGIGISKTLIIILVIAVVTSIITANVLIVKSKNAAKSLQINKKEHIDTLKKQYEFEQQQDNTRIQYSIEDDKKRSESSKESDTVEKFV